MQVKVIIDGNQVIFDSVIDPISVYLTEDEISDISSMVGKDINVYNSFPSNMNADEFDSIMG
jgi:hypothetical protein